MLHAGGAFCPLLSLSDPNYNLALGLNLTSSPKSSVVYRFGGVSDPLAYDKNEVVL